MQRFFSDSQKQDMFNRCFGRCEGCMDNLPNGWHAHHIKQYSDGGETDIENGMALCPDCHKKAGRGELVILRNWQRNALFSFMDHEGSNAFVLVAGVGAGKTYAASAMARYFIKEKANPFVIVVAPQKEVVSGLLGGCEKLGLDATEKHSSHHNPPSNYKVWGLTYQGLIRAP